MKQPTIKKQLRYYDNMMSSMKSHDKDFFDKYLQKLYDRVKDERDKVSMQIGKKNKGLF